MSDLLSPVLCPVFHGMFTVQGYTGATSMLSIRHATRGRTSFCETEYRDWHCQPTAAVRTDKRYGHPPALWQVKLTPLLICLCYLQSRVGITHTRILSVHQTITVCISAPNRSYPAGPLAAAWVGFCNVELAMLSNDLTFCDHRRTAGSPLFA